MNLIIGWIFLVLTFVFFIGTVVLIIVGIKRRNRYEDVEFENLQLLIKINKLKSGSKDNKINPENKCADLFKMENPKKDALAFIWNTQKEFQESLGILKKDMTIQYRIQKVTEHWRNLCVEFGELLDRVPYKEWKKYSKEQKDVLNTEEEKLEIYFEYIDMLHFMINIGLYLGITDYKLVYSLYKSKNRENINRQKRNY